MTKVLVVEDDQAMNDLVCLVLEDAGYEVLTAVDGMEGLKRVVQDQPQVVISTNGMRR